MRIDGGHRFALSEFDESRIMLLCEVAKANGSILSIQDVLSTASLDATQEEITRAWKTSRVLDSKYFLDSGYVFEKGSSAHMDSLKEEEKRRSRANSNVEYSKSLLPIFSKSGALSVSISGSTSYFSVSESDDLDFFSITKKNQTWIFLTRSLLLLRAKKILSKKMPDVCLGYTADVSYVSAIFLSSRSGLFARDALTALPILGKAFYDSLLKESLWMSEFFPKVFGERLSLSSGVEPAPEINSSVLFKIFNMFLYFTAGTYMRIKCALLNRKFSKRKEYDRIFALRIGFDRCVYEARSYLELRKLYSNDGRL
jgi:hypothetical protein